MNILNDSRIGYLQVSKCLDINKGDILVVASDITRLFYSEYEKNGELPNINKLIDTLKESVGIDGTVLFPIYSWEYCKGKPFDIRTSLGETGALGNAALRRKDFKRTKHPIYSFMVWGKYSNFLCSLENTNSWGEGTVFEFLYNNNAKWLLFDVDLTQGYSYVHHIEQMANAYYRYNKEFIASYTDENGKTTQKSYTMFVRDLEIDPQEDFSPMQKILLENGIAKHTIINDISYMIVDVKRSFQPIYDDVKYNGSKNLFVFPYDDERQRAFNV